MLFVSIANDPEVTFPELTLMVTDPPTNFGFVVASVKLPESEYCTGTVIPADASFPPAINKAFPALTGAGAIAPVPGAPGKPLKATAVRFPLVLPSESHDSLPEIFPPVVDSLVMAIWLPV